MARIDGIVFHLLKWECGATPAQLRKYTHPEALFDAIGRTVCDPRDPGGHTHSGITLATWKTYGYDNDGDGDFDLADLRVMTYAQWLGIVRRGYWDRACADAIRSQGVANMVVDFMFTSGGAARVVQRVVGTAADGVFGPKTVAALNARPAEGLFRDIRAARLQYYRRLPAWKHFGRGWTARVMDLQFADEPADGAEG